MKAMFHRELRALWQGMTGWIIAALVPLAFAVALAFRLKDGIAAEYMQVIMDAMLCFAPIIVIYAAQGYSKDARSGADRLLHSLPVNCWQVALGRYFAWCVPFWVGTGISLLYPVALSFFTNVSALQLAGGMLEFLLAGMAMIALALYLSRIHKSAIVNVLMAVAVLVICFFLSNISAYFVRMGLGTASAFLCFAVFGIWIGWQATRSWTAALVVGVAMEGAAILCLGITAEAGVAFWGWLCGIVNPRAIFSRNAIGILDMTNVMMFVLAAALFVVLSAFGWQMETLRKGRTGK